MTNTYNDPAKQLARVKLREFIGKNLLSFKDPKKVKVVCFPGAEAEGEEALEVREIYDPLGIPRQNIVGLERGKEEARRLESANLGIEVVCQDAHDFFKETDRKFDVISLDYKGQRTWRERDTTRYIAGNGILNNHGIFSHVHLGKRESAGMKIFMKSISTTFANAIITGQSELTNSLENIREEAITQDMLATFNGGIIELHPEKNGLRNMEVMERMRAKKMDKDTLASHFAKVANLLGGVPCAKGVETKEWSNEKAMLFASSEYLLKVLADQGYPPELMKSLVYIALSEYHKGYGTRNIDLYRYTSNKGGNMIVDMAQFSHLSPRLSNRLENIMSINVAKGMLEIKANGKNHSQIVSTLDEIVGEIGKYYITKMPERNYLGSSWQPKIGQRINQEQAIDLLSVGYSPNEIAEEFRGFTKMQLAAFKAHITMGTYKTEQQK